MAFSNRPGEVSLKMAMSLQHKLFISCNWMQLGVHKDPFIHLSLNLVLRKSDLKLDNGSISRSIMYSKLYSRVKVTHHIFQIPHAHSLVDEEDARLSPAAALKCWCHSCQRNGIWIVSFSGELTHCLENKKIVAVGLKLQRLTAAKLCLGSTWWKNSDYCLSFVV